MSDTDAQRREKRIDLKEAVEIAYSYFRQIYSSQEATNLLLEEVEEAPDGGYWLITLGFDTERAVRPPSLVPLILSLPRHEMARVYKTFRVDSTTGRVVSMKMRQVE